MFCEEYFLFKLTISIVITFKDNIGLYFWNESMTEKFQLNKIILNQFEKL